MSGVKPPRKSPARRCLLWFAAVLLLLVLAPVGSIYLLCVFQPELVASGVQQLLIETTGLPWRIQGSIRPSFRGGVGIVARNVRIIAASTVQGHYANAAKPLVHAESLRIVLDPASLPRLAPVMKHIELNRPTVNLVYDNLGRPLWLPLDEKVLADGLPAAEGAGAGKGMAGAENATAASAGATASAGPGSEAATEAGSEAAGVDPAFQVSAEAGSAIVFKSVADVLCSPYHAVMQPLVIRQGTFVSYTREGEVLLSFTGVEGRFTPGAEKENLMLSAAFDLPGADLSVVFDISARVGCEGIPARGSLKGRIAMKPPHSRTITAALASSFTWEEDGKSIDLPDFTLSAEGDLLSAELRLDMAEGEVRGPVAIHTISLPRWFEWARVLPPGLQRVLHSLKGEFDLDLTMNRAMALNLKAEAGLLRLEGSVGVPDFEAPRPTVMAEVRALNEPDLDLLLPFLGVPGRWIEPPVAPDFDHPPLAPYPEESPAPYDPGPGSVGYDIRVALEKARLHGVAGGPIKVRIAPQMAGKIEKTRVAIEGENLLKGSVKGHLDIDKDAILMRYEVKNADLALLPENEGSDTRIAGRATGSCEIDMPMLDDGSIADDWPLRIDAALSGCEISGLFDKKTWKLHLGSAAVKGQGSIYAVLERGVRLSGDWKVDAANIKSPWQPDVQKGAAGGIQTDALRGTYKGTLHWPVILGGPPKKGEKAERKTVDRVEGAFDLTGRVTLPKVLGGFALAGELKSRFDWSVPENLLIFTDSEFKGHGGYIEGGLQLDLSGGKSLLLASPSFTANPARLLKDWRVDVPEGLRVPGMLTGRMDLRLAGDNLDLEKIKVEVDGAPITGEARLRPDPDPAAPAVWGLQLTARHLDVDKFLPPDPEGAFVPPSTKPWNLDFFQRLALDANITVHNAKKGKMTLVRNTVTATVRRDRFSLEIDCADFYGGSGQVVAQGTVVPGSSKITLRKGLVHMRDVALGRLIQDMTGKASYAGTAELVADLKGTLGCNADIPGKLSGNWSLAIKDGLYPGFLTSEDSSLRNSFSQATASGPMENGVLKSNNFKLTGAMVDMEGEGWFDMKTRNMDMEVSVTFVKVPTVPVRFYGNASAPRMRVRGVDMVVETAQAAGSTIFGLVMGVLELPGHAIKGIGKLFGNQQSAPGDNKSRTPTKSRQPAQTMPVKPTGRR